MTIRKSTDARGAYLIACSLPAYFDAVGLNDIERDTKNHILYGAYEGDVMIGFATYREIDQDTIEMTWLAVDPKQQGKGVGKLLVQESLKDFSSIYKVCEVKTLAETDAYEPYKRTRDFYEKLGFVTKEIIDPYPAWGNNPCQIFWKTIGK